MVTGLEPGRNQTRPPTGDSGTLIWDAATGEQLDGLTTPGQRVQSAAWSPDGTMLTAGRDSGTLIWDPATGEQLRELTTPGQPTWSLTWSPDGTRLAVGGSNGTLICDPATGNSSANSARQASRHGHWPGARTEPSSPPAGLTARSSATRPPANSSAN